MSDATINLIIVGVGAIITNLVVSVTKLILDYFRENRRIAEANINLMATHDAKVAAEKAEVAVVESKAAVENISVKQEQQAERVEDIHSATNSMKDALDKVVSKGE